ncbi:UviB-like protein [Clostridium botulinum]|uniref:BhlA/UviB family holin-like peptide n=1 Tax=Clostridium botulinum TaxID=1491 RepID=UPI0007DFAB5F|nr:BhlA/UviB family holin-like peptide [Clostridium botulinum]AUN18779.1 UviB-like protein [Clostridium botulinum]KEI82016.1 UviB-like protein [Clostridium botulinum B2 331]KEI88196.1 UviB-like protein [Clostridium botulinum B2 267]MBY6794836.1 UviB-like protein [Clostridium botulinum]MBY6800686.1 UviB-like protein [Clostridium botulinum]
MNDLLTVALSQGLGYGLFLFLLLYVLKTTGERERRYQATIDKLVDKFAVVDGRHKKILLESLISSNIL